MPSIIPSGFHPGAFGALRKHDVHTGIDLYCNDGESVYAIEDGVVVNICDFTGPKVNLPWWNDTRAILIEGKSGVILYGELLECVKLGDSVKEGQLIGNIKRVLKTDKGLPMDMLHLELYDTGYRGDGEIWKHDELKPEALKDPLILL
jgi:murein DD-endopeptidase MepM/ murein hydrolase activator NlpD